MLDCIDSCGIKNNNITLDRFATYLKAVNCPDDPLITPDDDVLYFLERYENEGFVVMFQE